MMTRRERLADAIEQLIAKSAQRPDHLMDPFALDEIVKSLGPEDVQNPSVYPQFDPYKRRNAYSEELVRAQLMRDGGQSQQIGTSTLFPSIWPGANVEVDPSRPSKLMEGSPKLPSKIFK